MADTAELPQQLEDLALLAHRVAADEGGAPHDLVGEEAPAGG